MKNPDQILQQLKEIGVVPGNMPKPGGAYASVNCRGNIAYVAIQFPIKGDSFLFTGRLGKELTTPEGYNAAQLCAANAILQINHYAGLEKVEGLNHMDLYYQGDEMWDDGPVVANGASEFFNRALGEEGGRHTRAIFGVQALPRNFCVGLTCSFTVKS